MTPKRVSWSEFQQKCEELAGTVATRYQEDPRRWDNLRLVGILRGGMIVANVLSYLIESRYAVETSVGVVGIRRYPSDAREPILDSNNAVYHSPDNPFPYEFVVLVDEIAATGITLDQGRRVLEGTLYRPKVYTACLFSVGQKFADDVVEVVPEGTWVSFPWDLGGDEDEDSDSV